MAHRILAIGHDAYRAGAQIVFLHILRWLRQHHDSDISLLLKSGGELVPEYAAVVPTTVRGEPAEPRATSLVQRARRRAGTHHQGSDPGSFDLVYANSVATANLAVRLADKTGCPVICHVHELEMSIRRFTTPDRFRAAAMRMDSLIAVSGAVESHLVHHYGVEPTKVIRVPEAIPITGRHRSGGQDFRAELGIPPEAFVVGGCGTLDWRKGPDIFVLIAKEIAKEIAKGVAKQASLSTPARPFRFLWVGGEPLQLAMLEHDLARLGISEMVTFTGNRSDTQPYFDIFDMFLLTSREDPFPLVCLEAADAGLPIVCFADAGGMPEFVENDAGYVVPYLEIGAAVDRILALAASDGLCRTLGRRAAEKVAERCSIDVVGPQVAAAIDRHLS